MRSRYPRAVAWFDTQGITCKRVPSGNGSTYRSKAWGEAYTAPGMTPKRTKPYTPRTNGKAERYGLRPTSSISRPCWLNGPTPCRSRPQVNETGGCRAIWRSITAAGVTWPWRAALPINSADSYGLLNDLVKNTPKVPWVLLLRPFAKP